MGKFLTDDLQSIKGEYKCTPITEEKAKYILASAHIGDKCCIFDTKDIAILSLKDVSVISKLGITEDEDKIEEMITASTTVPTATDSIVLIKDASFYEIELRSYWDVSIVVDGGGIVSEYTVKELKTFREMLCSVPLEPTEEVYLSPIS